MLPARRSAHRSRDCSRDRTPERAEPHAIDECSRFRAWTYRPGRSPVEPRDSTSGPPITRRGVEIGIQRVTAGRRPWPLGFTPVRARPGAPPLRDDRVRPPLLADDLLPTVVPLD